MSFDIERKIELAAQAEATRSLRNEMASDDEPDLRNYMSLPRRRLSAFAEDFKDSYNDGLFSDLTVKCQDLERKVHKIVVCKHSEWFKTACTSQFKEGKAAVIELHEDEPEVIDAMLKYCYALQVDGECTFPFALKIFAAAEKYMMSSLQHAAAAHFELEFQAVLWTRLRDDVSSKGMGEHVAAIIEAYTNISDSKKLIKAAILKSVTTKLEYFDVNLKPQANEKYRELLQSHPEFAVDAALQLATVGPMLNTLPVRITCPHDKHVDVAFARLRDRQAERFAFACDECSSDLRPGTTRYPFPTSRHEFEISIRDRGFEKQKMAAAVFEDAQW